MRNYAQIDWATEIPISYHWGQKFIVYITSIMVLNPQP